MLIDSHCHLDELSLKDELSIIINRAKNSGVICIHTICTKLENLEFLIKITQKYPNIFSSVGVHPNEITNSLNQQNFSQILIEASNHSKIISFGETGLDYFYGLSSKKEQIYFFKEHITAAQKTKLPLVVHTRNAEDDTINILTNAIKNNYFTGVIHCFTGSKTILYQYLDLGLYISISGIVTFKNAYLLREMINFIPLDRLLIETDAPYLSPVPMRGQKNEPSFLQYIAHFIANLKNITLDELSKTTTNNFLTLFHKVKLSHEVLI